MQEPIKTLYHEGYRIDIYDNLQPYVHKEHFYLYIDNEPFEYFDLYENDANAEKQFSLLVEGIFENSSSLFKQIEDCIFFWRREKDNADYGFQHEIIKFTQDINLAKALERHIEPLMMGDYEYADNLRIADPDNMDSVKSYKQKRNSGCCGSYDEEIEIMGRKYMIGFNYGH